MGVYPRPHLENTVGATWRGSEEWEEEEGDHAAPPSAHVLSLRVAWCSGVCPPPQPQGPSPRPFCPLGSVHPTKPAPLAWLGQPGWAMNSTWPFSFPNIKCLLSIRGVWGNGNYRIVECPWVKKYLECRNLAGPLIRAGIIPAVI